MKIPFGKYKGRDVNEISEVDPSYIQWLKGIARGNLREKLIELTNDEEFNIRLNSHIAARYSDYIKEHFEREYEDSIKYEQDIDFWTKASPIALYDHIKKFNIEVDIDKWRYLCNELQKRGL